MQGLHRRALALWVFLSPTILVKAEAWLKSHGFPQGFRGSDEAKQKLTIEEIVRLQHDLGYELDEATGYQRPAVTLLWQHHGQVVHVPAGHMHMVVNLQPCIKMAWEYWKDDKLVNYILAWKFISSQMTRGSNSLDYFNTQGVVGNLLTEHMTKQLLQESAAPSV